MNRSTVARFGSGLFCALMLTAAAAQARPEGGPKDPAGRKERMEARFKRIEKEVGISSEQSQKLEEHRKTHWQEARRLFEQMRQKRTELDAAMESADIDMARIQSLHNDLKDVQNRLADHRMEGILAVRKILTPEQFKRFHALTREKRRRDGRGSPDGKSVPPPDEAPGENPPPEK